MKHLKRLIYGWVDRKFLGGCSSYNSLAVRKSCRSKLQARTVFAANGVPHAAGTTFFFPWTAFLFAREHGFPLVIKPNVSGFSRGSYFPITCYSELLKAALMVKVWWPVSVVEKYLLGRNYRVTVVAGEIMSVIRRYPPFVDGDGRNSIDTLIDRENARREEMGLFPVIHPIPKDGRVIGYLKKSRRTLTTVPADGERVYLFNRVALAPGGVVEIINKESMHPENRLMFERILDMFGANILGIDAIFEEGIEKDYREQKCILLEVNSRPYLKMHEVPRYGEKEDLTFYYERLNSLNIAEADIF
jgi:cyanophycin synthetase